MKREPICPRCGAAKKQLKSGVLRCSVCTKAWNREYYHRSAQRRENQRRYAIQKKYGVSIDYLLELLAKQNESGAICRVHWTACVPSRHCRHDGIFLQRLFVDHCHKSKRVRGLLCNKCNSAIAFLQEDPGRFDAAKRYLQENA